MRDQQIQTFRSWDRGLCVNGMPTLGFATFVMAASFATIAPLEQRINAHLNESPTVFDHTKQLNPDGRCGS